MNNRVYTVGSLIPGRLIAKPPVSEQTESKVIKTEVITVEQNGKRMDIHPVKGKLLDIALNQGKQINYKCRKGTCGQCTVKVLIGPRLSAPNSQEQKKLKNEITNGYRLACQAEIH
ncbi:2Fe-2S iron-sulfur cluster-binding protein [Neobacillus sp. DY30]|uniref:2Fe-2S iron-sulfur cluster-binding protein n=1 Tax=Neobacillus sp. DY30 TaxID=3047871 RepID=UPI0024BFB995|nr:2Fe-2S iron-sulfur cluster-binding protein [Neobacillus sp. DY30]WHX99898.1 2Fe-2S iron-sulfur cluster-binding protein [Neobacillus sp. DY30]